MGGLAFLMEERRTGMKKVTFLLALLAIAIFAVPTFARKPTPRVGQVEVVNNSENAVPVTIIDESVPVTISPDEPMPVTLSDGDPVPVTISSDAGPVPVVITGGSQKTIISAQGHLNSTAPSVVLLTVPQDKKLIITDIVASGFSLNSKNNASLMGKITLYVGSENENKSWHFNAGIPYGPNEEVIIELGAGSMDSGYIFISGYLTDYNRND